MNSNPMFLQDNDPKRTSGRVSVLLECHNSNWWKTPPGSPDLNLIEILLHELKEYLRGVVKPRTKNELIFEIIEFWNSVNNNICRKYISHLKKVMPK